MRLACLESGRCWPLACVYALDPERCGWLPERKIVEEKPCTGANPCCGFGDLKPEETSFDDPVRFVRETARGNFATASESLSSLTYSHVAICWVLAVFQSHAGIQ